MNSYGTSWWSFLLINRPREDERLSWPCRLLLLHLQLPFQPKSVTTPWPVPNYTACWQRHWHSLTTDQSRFMKVEQLGVEPTTSWSQLYSTLPHIWYYFLPTVDCTIMFVAIWFTSRRLLECTSYLQPSRHLVGGLHTVYCLALNGLVTENTAFRLDYVYMVMVEFC